MYRVITVPLNVSKGKKGWVIERAHFAVENKRTQEVVARYYPDEEAHGTTYASIHALRQAHSTATFLNS